MGSKYSEVFIETLFSKILTDLNFLSGLSFHGSDTITLIDRAGLRNAGVLEPPGAAFSQRFY